MVEVKGRSGQSLTEYVLGMALVALIYVLIVRNFKAFNLADKLLSPLRNQYAHTYRHGHPDARGPDDGGPTFHPRASGGDNFRLFINPEQQR